ncbi:MmgE/PrpD family protein [Pseudahrensia aquimaris]|uniref:MmgE/PrpD family protein n=1 Tax=Pseudahrensia aquimaris TaxID=744461 RepID=A0ABW3FFB2_9HYPH
MTAAFVQMLDTTASLSGELVGWCERSIDAADRARASLHLLDWLGCALAAQAEPMAGKLNKWSSVQHASGRAFAIGFGPVGAEQAAFANGGLGNLLEMDDLHRSSILHAGDVVVPAVLAMGQARQSNPKNLLDALVVGYEVALRIGAAAASGGYSSWYNSATCGVFGAAMGAAHVIGLDRNARMNALGQAGMQASGVWQCRLEATDSKQLATAHAARAGVTSVTLAEAGCAGASEILEGPMGFFKTYYPDANTALLLSTENTSWLLHDVSFKPWPSCRHTHPIIHLGLQMRERLIGASIQKIKIKTYQAGQSFCDNAHPKSDHEARFSLQHCLAVALVRGAPTLSDFGVAARENAQLAAMRSRIEVGTDEALSAAFPHSMGGALSITLDDGSMIEASTEHALGDPLLPLSAEQLREKFTANAVWGGVAEKQAEALIQAIDDLPNAQDLIALNAAVAATFKSNIQSGASHE